MAAGLVFLSLAVLVCKVNAQICSPPIVPIPAAQCVPIPCQPAVPPCTPPCPQVINPNPYVTTIIDNSVSNGLINALQLLIVSNLLGATVSPTAPLMNNLGPLLDSIVCQSPCPVELVIPEYVTYASSYDLAPPCVPITTCGPYYDFIPPCSATCGAYYDIIPPCGPTCGMNYEIIPPCGPIIDSLSSPLCLSDIISPNYFTYTDTIAPICIDSLSYNGYGDLLLPISGIETIGPNFCGGLTEIIPNYINYPMPDICPSINPYCGGFAETISPVSALPFGCLNEVVAPCFPPLANIYASESPFASFVAPNFYGGLAEMAMPLTAEVVIPSSASSLACNYGYSPSSLPCVRVNVEPLSYDNCIYNAYGAPVYY